MLEEFNGDFIQWLRGFYYVVKTGSIRQASEIMYRNPSTLSYQIKSLEEELGVVLFDRYKKSLIITEDGKKLFDWTVTTFETLQNMRSQIGSGGGVLQGSLNFSSSLPIASMAIPAIAKFQEENQEVDIVLNRDMSTKIVNDVIESRVDFGLLGLISEPVNALFKPLLKSRPLLVIRKDTKWKIPKIPTLSDLNNLPFISFSQDRVSVTEDPFFGFLQKNSLQHPKKVISVNNYHLMLHFVLHGSGVAILDELCLKSTCYGADWSPLVAYPIDHILPNVLYGLLVRKGKHLSLQAEAMMNELEEYFSSIPPTFFEYVNQ